MSVATITIAITVGERAVSETSKEVSTVTVQESSKRTMNDSKASFANAIATSTESSESVEVGGSYGLCSLSAAHSDSEAESISSSVEQAWAEISDLSSSDHTEKRSASKDVMKFQKGTTQIYATQTTTISIGGSAAITTKEISLGVGQVQHLGRMITGEVETDRLKKAWLDLLGILKPPETNRVMFKLRLPAAPTPTPLYGVEKIEEEVEWVRFWSTDPNEITAFINKHGPSDAHGVRGGVSFPNFHVWVRKDQTQRRYKFINGNWDQAAIDGCWTSKAFIGFRTPPQPYAYWVEPESISDLPDDGYEYFNSQNMTEIELFINRMGPNTVRGITGGISYPNLHVWVKRDNNQSKKYRFVLGDWTHDEEFWRNRCFIGFKSPPQPYAYYIENYAY